MSTAAERDAAAAGVSSTFLVVGDCRGGWWQAEASELDRLDAALSAYIASGKTRDELVEFTHADGTTVRVLVSDLRYLTLSTPEGRERQRLLDAMLKAENPIPE